MKIIGVRIEKYIGQSISGHNCDFVYSDTEFEKHIICAILSTGKRVEIELSMSEGECCSGWTDASWGHIEVKDVNKFNGYTHIPVKELIVDDIDFNVENVSNFVFNVSNDGEDSYYPSGGYYVNMDLFKTTIRHMRKRPVWIFVGDSNVGKSFISGKLNGLSVYETDMNKELPNSITTDVVVIGNKYSHSKNDVIDKLFGDTNPIIVDFKMFAKV